MNPIATKPCPRRLPVVLMAVLAGWLAGCASPAPSVVDVGVPRSAPLPPGATLDWQPLADVLAEHVSDAGRVDYFAISQPDAYGRLQSVMIGLAEIGPRSQPADYPTVEAKLAYYINAHNLLALAALAPRFAPGKVDPRYVDDLPAPPETGYRMAIDGERLTMAQIRRQKIAPLAGDDPRPMLGLTAGRRNDPPLRRELYRPDTLFAQLDDQLRRVLRGEPFTRINHADRHIETVPAIADSRAWFCRRLPPELPVTCMEFGAVLRQFADERGRLWLDRGLGYSVAPAPPSDLFNNQPLFRSISE